MKTAFVDNQYARVRITALHYLARREHSAYELVTKLSRRFSSVISSSIVEELSESGELSDQRFAQTLVRSRFNRGFGPIYIAKELRSKGIKTQLVKDCISAFDGDWQARAKEVLEKKRGQQIGIFDEESGGFENDDGGKAVNEKLARFLFGRGYPSEIVFRLL